MRALDSVTVTLVVVGTEEFCAGLQSGGEQMLPSGMAAGVRGGLRLSAAPGARLPARGTPEYERLIAVLEETRASYPDGDTVLAVYDGSELLVVVLPSLLACQPGGAPDPGPPPEPDEVVVEVEKLTEAQICAEQPGLPPAGLVPDDLEELGEDVADLVGGEARGEQTEAERERSRQLADELDATLARHPGSDVVVAAYVPGGLFVLLAPSDVDCGRRAEPAASRGGRRTPPPPPAAPAPALAATGADVPTSLALAVLALLMGAGLLRAGRPRRGA